MGEIKCIYSLIGLISLIGGGGGWVVCKLAEWLHYLSLSVEFAYHLLKVDMVIEEVEEINMVHQPVLNTD